MQTSDHPVATIEATPQVVTERPIAPLLPWWRDRVFIALLLGVALFGLIYNAVILMGYGVDEQRHIAYVDLLLREHRFPYVESNGTEHAGAHTFHPPLYYLLLLPSDAALGWLPMDTKWHVIRCVSLLLCLATLPLMYGIARQAARGDITLTRLTVAHVAWLPIFGMVGSTITNDCAVLFAITLFLWLLAVPYANERSLKAAALLGLCLGLGNLCKATALLCDSIAFLIYLVAQDGWLALRQPRNGLRFGVLLFVAALVSGPWHWYNFQLYGTFTHLPDPMPSPFLPNPRNGLLVMLMHDNFPPLFAMANWSLFFTLWSQKDWLPEAARTPIYGALLAYAAVALVGHLKARISARTALRGTVPVVIEATPTVLPDNEPARSERIAVWTAYGAFGSSWIIVLQIALFKHWGWAEGGRYLLPSMMGASLFLARGWRGLIGAARLQSLLVSWCLAMVALNGLAVYWLLFYLNPLYGPRH